MFFCALAACGLLALFLWRLIRWGLEPLNAISRIREAYPKYRAYLDPEKFNSATMVRINGLDALLLRAYSFEKSRVDSTRVDAEMSADVLSVGTRISLIMDSGKVIELFGERFETASSLRLSQNLSTARKSVSIDGPFLGAALQAISPGLEKIEAVAIHELQSSQDGRQSNEVGIFTLPSKQILMSWLDQFRADPEAETLLEELI